MSRKRCRIETLLLQTVNRKWHMTYRIAVIQMTLSDLHLLQVFWNGIFRTALQQLTRFQLTARRAVPLRQLSLLYNSSVNSCHECWWHRPIAVHMSVRPKHCSVVNCTVQSTLQIKNISIDPTINGHRPVQRVRLCTTVAWIRRGHAHMDHSVRVDSIDASVPLIVDDCHVLRSARFALESGAERLSFLVARST